MIGISGATANHAKKQTKKASQDIWKARICGVEMLNRSIRVALRESEAIAGLLKNETTAAAHGRPIGAGKRAGQAKGVGVDQTAMRVRARHKQSNMMLSKGV
jgi:hypothetical protein